MVQVAEFFMHPDYDNVTTVNDISILRLAAPLSFSNAIAPIALAPADGDLPVGANAAVSGWGYTEENGPASTQLQAVIVPIISRESCKALYPQYVIDETMLCAGYLEGQRDACQVTIL